jgi:hypothetical protein
VVQLEQVKSVEDLQERVAAGEVLVLYTAGLGKIIRALARPLSCGGGDSERGGYYLEALVDLRRVDSIEKLESSVQAGEVVISEPAQLLEAVQRAIQPPADDCAQAGTA